MKFETFIKFDLQRNRLLTIIETMFEFNAQKLMRQ